MGICTRTRCDCPRGRCVGCGAVDCESAVRPVCLGCEERALREERAKRAAAAREWNRIAPWLGVVLDVETGSDRELAARRRARR